MVPKLQCAAFLVGAFVAFPIVCEAGFAPGSSIHMEAPSRGFTRAPSTWTPASAVAASVLSMSFSSDDGPLAKLLGGLPTPLGNDPAAQVGGVSPSENVPNPIDPSLAMDSGPESLFARARAVIASDLGVRDPGLLADEGTFKWVGPDAPGGTGALGRSEYLAAGRFFDLRSTFPDLDYRAHDYRLDDRDPYTVRITARTVGTMRGELRLRSETLPPNGKRMICPPEAISITFDPNTGKVTKLVSGMVMDRLVGNTGGLGGVMAAATVAGAPPSEWEIYPPGEVVARFFRRSVKQLKEPTSVLAPFPETVMIQLAKGVIAADNGVSDPDLLAPEFTFCGPTIGPLSKDDYIKFFADYDLRTAFPDLDLGLTNFRVDPYDPYRVWADVRSSGKNDGPLAGQEPTGRRYDGPPEAVSFTFDDDGFCTRLTAGAVIDPSEGNTGGLGGIYGIFYAIGRPLPGISTRPISQNLGRIQRRLLQPFTGAGVDDVITGETKVKTIPVIAKKPDLLVAPEPQPPSIPPTAKKTPTSTEASASAPKPSKIPSPPKEKDTSKPRPFYADSPEPDVTKVAAAATGKTPSPPKSVPPPVQVAPKSEAKSPISDDPGDPVTDAFASFFGTKTQDDATLEEKKQNMQFVSAADIARFKAESEAARFKARETEAEEKKRDAAAAAAAAAALKKKEELERRKKEEAEAKKREMEKKKAEEVAVAARLQKEETEARKREFEQNKRAAEAAEAAEARKRAAEEKKRAAVAEDARKRELAAAAQSRKEEAERRKREEEERTKKYAAAESRKRELEEKRAAAAAAAQARKEELEAKRKAAAEQAAMKKRELEEKRKAAASAAQAKREEADAKKKASAAVKAEKILNAAQPRVTIDLFGVFGTQQNTSSKGDKLETEKKATAAAKAQETLKAAKAGATINLFGLGGFQPKEEAAANQMAAPTGKSSAQKASAAKAQQTVNAAKPGATINLFSFGSPQPKPGTVKAPKAAASRQSAAQKAAAARKAADTLKAAKPGATINLFGLGGGQSAVTKAEEAAKRKEEAAKKAEEVLKAAKPRVTINLFEMFQPSSSTAEATVSKKAKSPKTVRPPRGIPVITEWRVNRDKSVTGIITGAPNFKDGTTVTTSRIASGTFDEGSIVTTKSGSKYFLG